MDLKDLLEGKVLLNETTVTDIADKIRAKTGNSSQMLPSEMPGLIDTIKGEPTLQSKTVTPSESAQSVTADDGYDGLDAVTVNAIPSAYVKPAATKGAATYTPKTTAQTIAAGTYCSGAQTIAGDANLVAANILSGKTIFGVAGSASSAAKVVTGTFSASGTTIKSQTITHDLGKTPNFAVLLKTTSNASTALSGIVVLLMKDTKHSITCGLQYSGTAKSLATTTQDIAFSSTEVEFKTSGSQNFYGTYRYVIAAL